MVRVPLMVRDAVPGDAEDLLGLWSDAGRIGEPTRSRDDAARALADLGVDPDQRLLVGEHAGVVVASLMLRLAPVSPVHTEVMLATSYLMVRPEFRRHGYAHALLETAVTWAEEQDIGFLSAVGPSGQREINRFLACLGFAEAASMRFSTTGLLRKRLRPERPELAGRSGTRQIGAVLAQRRTMRRRQAEGTA